MLIDPVKDAFAFINVFGCKKYRASLNCTLHRTPQRRPCLYAQHYTPAGAICQYPFAAFFIFPAEMKIHAGNLLTNCRNGAIIPADEQRCSFHGRKAVGMIVFAFLFYPKGMDPTCTQKDRCGFPPAAQLPPLFPEREIECPGKALSAP